MGIPGVGAAKIRKGSATLYPPPSSPLSLSKIENWNLKAFMYLEALCAGDLKRLTALLNILPKILDLSYVRPTFHD